MKWYLLIDKRETHGYTSNQVLYTLDWIAGDNLEQLQSVIDPTYRNYKRCGWERIIEHAAPWGVYQNLLETKRSSKQGFRLIHGDSQPHWIEELTLDEIARYIELRLQEQTGKQERPPETICHGLFEVIK